MEYPFNLSPTKLAPLELILNLNLNVTGKYLLLSRENYPYHIYIKYDINNNFEEIYPLYIKDTLYSIKVLTDNIPISDYDFKHYAYLSWDMKNEPNELYIPKNNKIIKYRDLNIETRYTQYQSDFPIKLEIKPDYVIECIKNDMKYKWVVGYSPLNPSYNLIKEKYFNFL